MEPEHYYVRDASSKAAHHWDYLRDRATRGLCAHEYEGPILYEGEERPPHVCRACQALLPSYHENWWRAAASAAQVRLDQAAIKNERLQASISRLAPLTGAWVSLENPPFYFVRDSVSPIAHHWDYLRDRHDTALCGYVYAGTIDYEGAFEPDRLCGECQNALPAYEAEWWRNAAHKTEALRRKEQQRADLTRNELERVKKQLEHQRRQLH